MVARYFAVKMSTGCTCGPHPCVDLTEAYLQYHHKIHHQHDASSNSKQFISCREKIRQACRTHGCFHVSIKLTNNSENDYPIACLAKPLAQVEDEIESLFSPSFLKHTDANFNGGIFEVPMKELSSSATSMLVEAATFRGRTAESGDESQANPEPKLSWEFRRCLNARIQEAKNPVSSQTQNEWTHLSNWTEALHSVASVVIHSLGISQQIVLNEKRCDCLDKICSNQNCNNLSQENCNVDLLRCFRYDALPFEQKDRLGSSSHSDWGALTAVFQDDKGGLQTYCHACEKWTDVATPERKMTGNTANLFIHVGDFLSLTSHKEGKHPPIWPSPRHRVVCPTKKLDQSEESSQCRRSLVYFAYPPPNNSLAAAQGVVEPLISDFYNSSIKFQDYSLLHDQSQQQQGADQLNDRNRTCYEKYLDIRGKPFGKVIQEKWNQVQRS